MHVRFRYENCPSSTASHRGGGDICNVIAWAGQAAAGATAPTNIADISQGLSQFYVINNTEAGGWSLINKQWSPTQTGTSYSFYVTMQSNSPKTSRGTYSDYKKRIRLASFGGYNAGGNWGLQSQFYDDLSSSVLADRYCMGTQNVNTTAGGWHTFYGYSPYDFRSLWHNISITEDYFYYWVEKGNFAVNTMPDPLVGFVDLDGTPANWMSEKWGGFNSVGYARTSRASNGSWGSTTTNYVVDMIQYAFTGIAPNNVHPASLVSSQDYLQNDSPTTSITNTGTFLRSGMFYQPDSLNAWYTQYTPTFDTDGKAVGGLFPLEIYSPFSGVPYQRLKGIYTFLPNKRNTNVQSFTYSGYYYWLQYNNVKIYDENGDQYVLSACQYTPHIKAIRSM